VRVCLEVCVCLVYVSCRVSRAGLVATAPPNAHPALFSLAANRGTAPGSSGDEVGKALASVSRLRICGFPNANGAPL